MEYALCKIQYVTKAETPFSILLYNHESEISDPNTIQTCRHFNHQVNEHAKLTLI